MFENYMYFVHEYGPFYRSLNISIRIILNIVIVYCLISAIAYWAYRFSLLTEYQGKVILKYINTLL